MLRTVRGWKLLRPIRQYIRNGLAAIHVLKLGAVSEIDRPVGGASPTQHGGSLPSAKRDIAQHVDLYKVAYQEAQRALDDQQGELRSMRDRSVQFTAFIGAATAFLVGTGLHPAYRDVLFYILASVASALSVALILLLLALLTPSNRRLWYYRLSAKSLIAGYIETEVPPPTEAHFLRALAERYDGMRVENEKLLSAVRAYYRWLIVVGIAQITVWAALVWVKG
jgi:hypothetical protein